uniref:Uncharacterized protein n=1 Tax=Romanomermis culicivorax TaxID=13658 RepID=A0A915K2A8_ROMCU
MSAVEEEILELLSSLNVAAIPRELLDADNDQEKELVGDLEDIFEKFLDLIDSKRAPLIDILKTIFKGFVPILTLKLLGASFQHDKVCTEMIQVKNRCLDFIVQLSSSPDYRSTTRDLIYILMQHICVKTPQKAIFHSKNIPTILQLHDLMLDENLRHRFYNWLGKFSRHAKVNYRTLAVEIALSLLSKLNSCGVSDSSRYILLQIILKRCSDVTSSIIIKALGGLRNLLSEDGECYSQLIRNIDLNLNFEESNHARSPKQSKPGNKRSIARSSLAVIPLTPAQEDVSLKNSNVKEAKTEKSEEDEQENELPSNTFFDMIVRRCSDEKVFVRRTALQVLQCISKDWIVSQRGIHHIYWSIRWKEVFKAALFYRQVSVLVKKVGNVGKLGFLVNGEENSRTLRSRSCILLHFRRNDEDAILH